jgi:putative DNA primase/helicase
MDNLDIARSALFTLDPGCDRETWVRLAMAAKAEGLSVDDFIEWSTPAHNFSGDKECAKVWNSIKQGSVTGATLFRSAMDVGWKNPARGPQSGYATHLHVAPVDGKPIESKSHDTSLYDVDAIWESCLPASDAHPYILAKRGQSLGMRVVPTVSDLSIGGHHVADWLVVPVRTMENVLQTLQFIPPPGRGQKLNLPGGSFGAGFYWVGELDATDCIYVCEGIGQAWACHSATGCAGVVSFGAGRITTVATLLRRKYPTARIVIVPDRGKEAQAESVAKAVNGTFAALPEDKPTNYDVNDFAIEYGPEALAQVLEHAHGPQLRYRLLGAADLAALTPLSWLVRGVLPATGLACVYGASGSGKSFLSLDLAAAVSSGTDWFNCRAMCAPVVYAALEGEAGFTQRVKAWQMHHGTELPQTLRFVMQPFDLRKPADIDELADAVAKSGSASGLVVIDTLNRAASGADENSSADMGLIIEAAKALQAKLGGLVLLVHHSGKDQSKGLRGHSSLHAALDAAIEVVRIDNRRRWRIAKSKDDTDNSEHEFQLETIEVGKHPDGESITSCVVVPSDITAPIRRTVAPKAGNQKVAWDALREVLPREGMTPTSDDASGLTRRPHITVERAIEAVKDRLPCDPKRRTERAQQALTGLQSKHLVRIERGQLWIP